MSKNLLHWKMLSVIQFDGLELKLLTQMNKVLHFQDIEIEDRQIVENALALWLACLLYQPDIL